MNRLTGNTVYKPKDVLGMLEDDFVLRRLLITGMVRVWIRSSSKNFLDFDADILVQMTSFSPGYLLSEKNANHWTD